MIPEERDILLAKTLAHQVGVAFQAWDCSAQPPSKKSRPATPVMTRDIPCYNELTAFGKGTPTHGTMQGCEVFPTERNSCTLLNCPCKNVII